MNRKELISEIVNRTELTKKETEQALTTFFDVVMDTLVNGRKVSLHGFGTFEVVERAARNGHNPKTGQSIVIPSSKAPKFKASKVLKEAVNG